MKYVEKLHFKLFYPSFHHVLCFMVKIIINITIIKASVKSFLMLKSQVNNKINV